jgi:hypothetical protein
MAALAERALLLPLTKQAFELAEVCFPRVDGLGCAGADPPLFGAGHTKRTQEAVVDG